jgi:hypothetical protein
MREQNNAACDQPTLFRSETQSRALKCAFVRCGSDDWRRAAGHDPVVWLRDPAPGVAGVVAAVGERIGSSGSLRTALNVSQRRRTATSAAPGMRHSRPTTPPRPAWVPCVGRSRPPRLGHEDARGHGGHAHAVSGSADESALPAQVCRPIDPTFLQPKRCGLRSCTHIGKFLRTLSSRSVRNRRSTSLSVRVRASSYASAASAHRCSWRRKSARAALR